MAEAMKAGGWRRRTVVMALALVTAMSATALTAAFLPSQGRSPRIAAVQQMLRIAASPGGGSLAPLVTATPALWHNFDVVDALTPDNFRSFIGNCRPRDYAESLRTVSVRFDCARDAKDEFIVDFRFCGAKVHNVSWPEQGRRLLSPVVGDTFLILGELIGAKSTMQPPCPERSTA